MPFVQRMLTIEPSESGHSDRLCRLDSSGQGSIASTTNEIDRGSKPVSNDVMRFVQVCRLLSCLVVHADDIFADLATECRQVMERTDRLNGRLRSGLADSVARLDAKTAQRPNRALSAAFPMVVDASSTTSSSTSYVDFHACYGYSCRLLTPSSRPNSVSELYVAADSNPCPLIAACDRYRGDGISGATIFSPCLTLQSLSTAGNSDDVDSYCGGDETVVKMFRSASAVSSLTMDARKPTRIRTPRLSVTSAPSLSVDSGAETLELVNETLTDSNDGLPATSRGALISVDVTGSNFAISRRRLPVSIFDADQSICHRKQECAEQDEEPPVGFGFAVLRKKSVRKGAASSDSTERRLRSSVSDLKNASFNRSRSCRVEKYAPISVTPVGQPRARPTTVRQLKKRGRPGTPVEESGLCSSWRRSLCTASQSLDDDSTDLWAECRPSIVASASASAALDRSRKISLVTVGVSKSADKSSLFRSQSLPRSFKNSLPIPIRRLLSSRTISTDGFEGHRTDVGERSMAADDRSAKQGKKETVVRPQLSDLFAGIDAIASETGDGDGKNGSDSLERAPSRRSLRRKSIPRSGPTGVQNFTVTPTSGVQSPSDNHEVHVEIHDQPWTKPFATVKLRPYSNSVDDAESCRSSSGHWSGESMSVCQFADRDSFNPTEPSAITTDIPSYSDTDSAVSLPVHCNHRTESSRLMTDGCFSSYGAGSASSFGDLTIDDQLSLFSVDQDGFFTSMHADSGLTFSRRHGSSTATLVADTSVSNDASSTCSFYGTTTTVSPEKAAADGTMASADVSSTTPSKESGERSSSPSVSQLSGSSLEVPTRDLDASTETLIDGTATRSSSAERPQSDSSAAAVTSFMSLVAITPPGSDDEEGDLLTWRSEWQRHTTKLDDRERATATISTFLTDGNAYDSSVDGLMTSFSTRSGATGCLTIPRVVKSKKHRFRDACVGTDVGFSTWPCSPVLKFDGGPVRGILKSSSTASSSNQKGVPKSITFCPVADCVASSPSESTGQEPMPVHARLVVSTPIPKQSSYAKNYHRRMVCRRVTHDELAMLTNRWHPVQRCSTWSGIGDVKTGSADHHFRQNRERARRELSPVISRGMTSIRESPELELSTSSGTCFKELSSPTSWSPDVSCDRVFFARSDHANESLERVCLSSDSRWGTEVMAMEPMNPCVQKLTKRHDLKTKTNGGYNTGKYSVSKNSESAVLESSPLFQKRFKRSSKTAVAVLTDPDPSGSPFFTSKFRKGKTRKNNKDVDEDSFEKSLLPAFESSFIRECLDDGNVNAERLDDSSALAEHLVSCLGQMSSSDVSECNELLTRSTDSISSTLSAASERHRAAKLAFFGVDSDPRCLPPAVALATKDGNTSFQFPLYVNRSTRSVSCNDSCSSSGVGSSVSASPMESPNSDCSTSSSASVARCAPNLTDTESIQLPADPSHNVPAPSDFKRPCDPVKHRTKTYIFTKQTTL